MVPRTAGYGARELMDSKGILLQMKDKFFGKQWMEWRVTSQGQSMTCLSQTVFFCPHGLPGFLYWYLFYPLHLRRFRNFIDTIAKRSETR
jgi:hypothetical protein